MLGVYIRYKRYPINSVERIFLNRVRTSQTLASYISQREFKDVLFKAFLKFNDGEKIHLDADPSHEGLRKRLLIYNQGIRTTIFDNYAGETLV
jgi:hypothetical protein